MSLDSEHEDLKQMLELSKQVTDSYQNIHNQLNYKPVVKKRVYNLNRSYCEKSSHGEEEPDSILSYLIERLSQQHKLDLTKFEHSDHFDKMDRHLVAKSTLAEKDSEFLLTKSLYAQNKTIGENNKLITALSINEIETRRSICVDQEEKEEKNVQEEIVLIGEKSDIDSLLDNENNQLYNLLVANSSRVDQLTDLETNLNKQRLSGLRQIRPLDEHVHIEIELEPEPVKEEPAKEGPVKEEPQGKEYETELNDVAKYLVDEITKISLNKVKIDYLNEKYESKSLDMDKLIEKEMGASGGASTESKQHLVEYYRNLEQNLHQVRSEIDKLKQEAVEDLAYLSKVLNTDQMDIEDFYLNNDTDTEYLSQSTLNNGSSQVYLTPAESFSRAEENTLTSPTDAESDNEETRLTVKEMDPEEENCLKVTSQIIAKIRTCCFGIKKWNHTFWPKYITAECSPILHVLNKPRGHLNQAFIV
ncbi:hypothetical protein BpHYR1_019692 [Brachionus plicatilis]|uniref:Uncharacterized protein n=1 Tax=Brachionus plicatilis TaxID=10195 RepID=A0A3M7Q753_BRAPC|nr:hypothetical protein BpHYR1_019692 [Brachionus plicatilis]